MPVKFLNHSFGLILPIIGCFSAALLTAGCFETDTNTSNCSSFTLRQSTDQNEIGSEIDFEDNAVDDQDTPAIFAAIFDGELSMTNAEGLLICEGVLSISVSTQDTFSGSGDCGEFDLLFSGTIDEDGTINGEVSASDSRSSDEDAGEPNIGALSGELTGDDMIIVWSLDIPIDDPLPIDGSHADDSGEFDGEAELSRR